MVMTISINGHEKKLIFDTGAQYNLLFNMEDAKSMGLEFHRKMVTSGADKSQELVAYLSRVVRFGLKKKLEAATTVLVLERDYLELEKILGTNIDGILGSTTFYNSVVHVDNRRSRVKLIPIEKFEAPSDYQAYPIEITGGRPFIYAPTSINNESTRLKKYLLDTGSSIPLLLYAHKQDNFVLPKEVIPGKLGVGLGGNLEGFVGKIHTLEVGEFEFNHFPTSFQVLSDTISRVNESDNRDGVIGNGILSRFNYYIDYLHNTLYLKPLRSYNKEFLYDKSGLTLVAAGENLERIIVQDVIQGSPAAIAGIVPGDEIVKFQSMPVSRLNIGYIQGKLMKKEGKLITMVLTRNYFDIEVKFRLRELF